MTGGGCLRATPLRRIGRSLKRQQHDCSENRNRCDGHHRRSPALELRSLRPGTCASGRSRRSRLRRHGRSWHSRRYRGDSGSSRHDVTAEFAGVVRVGERLMAVGAAFHCAGFRGKKRTFTNPAGFAGCGASAWLNNYATGRLSARLVTPLWRASGCDRYGNAGVHHEARARHIER